MTTQLETLEWVVDWPDCCDGHDHLHTHDAAIEECKAELLPRRALVWEAIRTRTDPAQYRVRATGLTAG